MTNELTEEQQARADKIRADFQAQQYRGDAWMPLVPQAVFLSFKPLRSEERSLGKVDAEEIFRTGREGTREGYIYSYNCLVKRKTDTVPVNLKSGTKIITPRHLGITPGSCVGIENAAPYALGRVLWMLNHGKWRCNTGTLKGLHIYCPEDAAAVIGEGLANDFAKAAGAICLHPRQRKLLNHLVQRIGKENLTVTPVYNDDEKETRRTWHKIGRQVCDMGEYMWRKSWRDEPPPGWKPNFAPGGKMTGINMNVGHQDRAIMRDKAYTEKTR